MDLFLIVLKSSSNLDSGHTRVFFNLLCSLLGPNTMIHNLVQFVAEGNERNWKKGPDLPSAQTQRYSSKMSINFIIILIHYLSTMRRFANLIESKMTVIYVPSSIWKSLKFHHIKHQFGFMVFIKGIGDAWGQIEILINGVILEFTTVKTWDW